MIEFIGRVWALLKAAIVIATGGGTGIGERHQNGRILTSGKVPLEKTLEMR